MAAFYELRYWKNFEQPDGSIIRLEIHSKGIEGVSFTAYEIGPVVQALALTIQGQTEDVDAPIVKTSLTMTFVDAPDHADSVLKKCGDWEEFYTNDSTYWKVLIKAKKDPSSASYAQLWGGYVTPDSFSEELRYRGSVTIVARDNIGHMQDFPFDAEGDENGLISLKELVEAAWAKIESPMTLYWPALRWLHCEGVYAFDTRMNVSAFRDMNWYEAVEKALYSYGAVMRYNGENQVLLCSLRYMPQQARPTMDQVNHIEPIFVANAQRELVPAVRRIEETAEYDLENAVTMPQVKEADFTGGTQTYRCKIDGIDMGNGSFGTSEHDAPVWPIELALTGWLESGSTLFFNPDAYEIGYFSERKGLTDDIYRYMYIACNNTDKRSVSFSRNITCSDMTVRMKLGQPVSLDKNNKLEQQAVFNLKKISYSIRMIQDGITNYLANDGRWVVGEEILTREYDAKTQNFDFEHYVPMEEYSGSAELIFTIYKIEYAQTSLANLAQYGLYACLQSLSFVIPESLSILKKNTVNTKYQDSNNVILSRDPEIAPAYNSVALPGFIKNGIFYYDGNVIMPAKAWSWNGGTPQQMAVYNHLQLLCYHSKPNNLITGDIVNADVIKTAAIYVWGGKEHLLISGTYNYLNGRIEGAVLREFVRYDDMWGEVSGTSLPDTEQSSTTNQEGGGASSGPSSTNENTTNVVIGGEGGGSVTIDPFLSDTSSNPVESKAIKAYIDSADNEIKERLAALEEGGKVDHPVFEFTYDTTTNKATAEMVAALAEAIAADKLILCNGRTYKFILEQDGMYGLVSDAYLDIMTNSLKTSVLAVMSSSYDVQLMEEEVPVGTEITEATIRNWGFTKNAGTITGIKMNGETKGTSGVVDLGNVLTEHQKLKTINNQSIVGEGNITIQGGGATPRVEMTAASAAIEPNKFYVWPMMDELNLTLGAEQSGVMNRYLFQFRNPKAGLTMLTLPDDITWSEDTELDENGMPVMEATAFYRIEIIEGLASLKKWKLVYIQFADAEVERVLMSKGVGDGIGITKRDAKAVTSIGTWFKSNKVIVQFPELPLFGITEIPNDAFNGCTNLLSLCIPANIERIGTYAFYQCSSMNIDIVADNITEIGPRAFYQSAITSFSSEGVVTIGNLAFNGCLNLHEVRLGEGCSYVGADSFAGCANLKAVTIGSNVATIMNYAFGNCSGLNEIVIYAITPPSLPYTNALTNTNNCPIYVPDASVEAYRSATNWVNYAPRIYSLTDYALGAIIIEFVDEQVKTICLANYDLNGDGELKNIEAWTVTSFGKVFSGKPITSFRESARFINVTEYGLNSFTDCASLVEIDLSNAVSVVDGAFANCSSLAWLGSVEKVHTLGNAAFRDCTSLAVNVYMPMLSVLQGNYAFASSGVDLVTSLGIITSTQFQMFASCTSLRCAILPSTLEKLSTGTFAGCTAMQAIICNAVTPPSVEHANALNNSNSCPIYVPSESVEAYKAANMWSAVATRIRDVADLPTELPTLYAEIEQYL